MLDDTPSAEVNVPVTRGYQQEMLEESTKRNIIIAMDTGSGKTHIAVLRIKHEIEREPSKAAWFFAPTVALCAQQKSVIQTHLPVSVGLVSGALEPDQWKSAELWERVLNTHRVIVSTPQVFLDALRHAYIDLGKDISLLVFDEAHHATGDHPYARIMDFYYRIEERPQNLRIYGISQVSRPYVLGLTASPIYGGDVVKSFSMLEKNLDCIIRAPRRTRAELAQFVHRPIFQHVMYNPWSDPPFSTNLAVISNIVRSLHIEKDPYVVSLRKQLATASPLTSEYFRLDQKLSLTIRTQKTFVFKGLRDFERAASDILVDLGPWAADWYVWRILEKAREAANPFNNIMASWKDTEKSYLLQLLNSAVLTPVSYHEGDLMNDCSDKLHRLIETLLNEKMETEGRDEVYSGLVFVQRRDTVIALSEVLNNHPFTKNIFRIGFLLGTSDNSRRHSFLDISRKLARDSQEETMAEFRSGELNLIIATAVAEEGIDIQACGSVIRWDLPPNMASWAQSRGRARKQRSTFTLMFANGSQDEQNVHKWEMLERQMVQLYNDPERDLAMETESLMDADDDDVDEFFVVKSTGASTSVHSAISHLAHFCAVIPTSAHVDIRPIYEIDPPEMPLAWHADPSRSNLLPYAGPWGSKVTLPRCLPLSCREFTVPANYPSKVSAHRHVAFEAYVGLYKAGLLNENLLPLTSVIEPQSEDVQAMLKDVERRAGMTNIGLQMDPWVGLETENEETVMDWYTARICIGDLPPLTVFTRSEPVELGMFDGPKLFHPGADKPISVTVVPIGKVLASDGIILEAKLYTRRLFSSLNWSRMDWDNLDFSYLFYPESGIDDVWEKRRGWLAKSMKDVEIKDRFRAFTSDARVYGEVFGYNHDPVLVLKEFGRPYRFVDWRYEILTEEEEEEMKKRHRRRDGTALEIVYPLLVVKPFHPRCNFLVPTKPRDPSAPAPEIKYSYLMPELSGITLISSTEVEYAFLLPSVLRSLESTLTMASLRSNLFLPSPALQDIPLALISNAMTASSAGEKYNYQRLETLGDTVLKFLVAVQVLVEYPFWHEGYLTKKKDHTVANVNLAKENIKRGLYRWLIRDIMLGRKWKPRYMTATSSPVAVTEEQAVEELLIDVDDEEVDSSSKGNVKKRTKSKSQEFSTKTLADVVESLIGAAYIHGGCLLGYECTKLFGLGLRWVPPPERVKHFLDAVEPDKNIPSALHYVEKMLGYTFEHKILLLEALTHASYQQDVQTVSYERMEFLGDSVLDLVVTDYLYHAPGKNYSPGHIHLRRSSVVTTHFLAYICLNTSVKFDALMPRADDEGIHLLADAQEVMLWQCMLHSSSRVLDDQANTFTRFKMRREEIGEALKNDTIFPWAALTRLQAPKFYSDIVESVIGAVFLDSGGDVDTARDVITTLGILPVLERIVKDNVDVWHPVSRISQWASKHEKELEWKFERERGVITCNAVVDGEVEASAIDVYRGTSSKEEVKLIAAEEASRSLRLRGLHMNQQVTGKGRGKGRGKGKGKGKGRMKEEQGKEKGKEKHKARDVSDGDVKMYAA